MALSQEFESQGVWLFRWRSYLPLVLVVLLAIAITQFDWTFKSPAGHEIWEYVCIGISMLGLIVRMIVGGSAAARTSGRNSRRQLADELNSTGIYSTVRHPLYLGNYLIGLGVSLVMLVWWMPVIYTLTFWLYYERIMFAEEAFLRQKFGAAFEQWASVTPAFWPNFRLWQKPKLPFSFRHAVRREYTAMMVIVVMHTGIEFIETTLQERRLVWEPFWVTFFAAGTILYLVLRLLKRETTVLDVAGRLVKKSQ